MALTDRELYTHNEQFYIAASNNLFKRYYPALERIEETMDSQQDEPTREQLKQYALLAALAASYCVNDEQLTLIAKAVDAMALLTIDELFNILPLNKQLPGQHLLHYRSSKKALLRYQKQYKLSGVIGKQHIRNVLMLYANDHITRLLKNELTLNLNMRRGLMLL